MDLRASAFLSFIPWLVMAAGSSAAGLLADGLVRAGYSVVSVRKGVQVRRSKLPHAAVVYFPWPCAERRLLSPGPVSASTRGPIAVPLGVAVSLPS